MTVRRASVLGLAGLVLAVWIIAVGCNLDPTGYGETQGLCSTAAHCDDQNPCTDDACGANGSCVHTSVPDGSVADGVTGNCKVIVCAGGAQSVGFLADDVDDGNDCTADACADGAGGITATHNNLPAGVACAFKGAYGTCDGAGTCVAECGFAGDDGVEVGCPAGPNPCTLSFCDKAKGACVLEKLDGIPSPASAEPPGECGGSYCIDGVESTSTVEPGTDCTQPEGMDLGKPGVCNDKGECVGCNTKEDCQDATPESECHKWVCMSGTCMNTTEPDGPLSSQTIGDCHVKVCTGGIFVDQIDANDTQDDGNECTTDICVAGVPDHVNKPLNTQCGGGGMLYCDAGICKGCTQDPQCLGGTECKIPKCDAVLGQCYLQNEPAGKVINAQTVGDCINNVCDMNGNITTAYFPADPQNDNIDCTVDTCVMMNQTSHTPAAYGSTCNDDGGTVCDASAHCVGKPCAVMGDCPGGTFCVDGRCCDSTCGATCQACSASKKGAGPNGLCGVIVATDPDSECPGNSSCGNGVCQPLGNGAPCANVAGECSSGNCVDSFCCNAACNGTCFSCSAQPGTCSAIANGQDPQNECANGACDGTGTCRKDNGQTCVANGDCLSNICVDGVCCGTACGGTCQACNVAGSLGACTNVPNNQDPANECANGACNGGGQCKLDNGQTCGGTGDCLSGFCADGVCCSAGCTGTCQACTMAKTGGANGTCGNVSAASDPDSECVGVTNCNGAGACTKLANGTACTLGGECSSGNCVDGVCCNTSCTGTCNACNLGGSMGTCTLIPSGQDPTNECTGNGGTDVCDGAGACKRVNGTTCSNGGNCISGNCIDNVCCNNTCSGTCQACNVSGMAGTCSSVPNGTDPISECAGVTNCNGAGGCTKLTNGATCTTNGANGECSSANCVDSVCCNAACTMLCEACSAAKTGGADGTCAAVTAGTDPDNDCAGVAICDGTTGAAACKKPLGAACVAGECASGNCIEGVCCNTSCTDDCKSCLAVNTASPDGTCDFVDVNTDPLNDCGGALVCDIMGMCVGGPLGASCASGTECGTANCVDNVCCDTTCTGLCQACSSFQKGGGPNGVCGSINNGLDPDVECPGAQVCNGAGACIGAGIGTGCVAGTECASGNCIDSVCCDTQCTGFCQACSSFKKGGGTNGACGNIASGVDPDGECTGAGMDNCNGAGMCGP